MSSRREGHVRATRRLCASSAVLFVTVVSFGQIAHAASEVAVSATAVESGHSDACRTVHGGATCLVLGSLQFAQPSATARIASGAEQHDAGPALASNPVRSPTASLPPPARAPPRR